MPLVPDPSGLTPTAWARIHTPAAPPGAPGSASGGTGATDPFNSLAALYAAQAGGGAGQALPPAVVIQPQAQGSSLAVWGVVLTVLGIALAWYWWRRRKKHHAHT